MKTFIKTPILAACVVLTLSACQTFNKQAQSFAQPSALNEVTAAGKVLANIPPADKRVAVALYTFADKTGQHKPNDNIAQYSRAVTQGGLEILSKALLDAGNKRWFHVLERGGFNNLIQERKIIRTMREQFTDAEGKQLAPPKPLMYAGVLLEGGIIAYDSNVITGGFGARYLGIGGSTEYRRDVVTVNLRASSIETGEVLLSVNTSKTIYSSGASAGVFKYVAFDKLLEIETGFTYNEPPQLAVRQAIESAVYAMVMEGAIDGLWSFKDGKAGKKAVDAYIKRRDQAPSPEMEKAEAPTRGKNFAERMIDGIFGSNSDQLAEATPVEKPEAPVETVARSTQQETADVKNIHKVAFKPSEEDNSLAAPLFEM